MTDNEIYNRFIIEKKIFYKLIMNFLHYYDNDKQTLYHLIEFSSA